MHCQSIELRGQSRRGTPLVILFACLGALAGCAGSHESGSPPATASTEPEPNSVLEKDRQMAFSRESPAPTPEQSATPQTASSSPGVPPNVQPTRAESHTPSASENTQQAGSAEPMPPADPATAKQDQRVIDKTAATSERLADQTAAHTKNARDRSAVPAGTPKSADTKSADTKSADNKSADNKSADNKPAQPSAANAPNDQHASDNTARNKRDRDDATLTPPDQSNAAGDRDLTAKIRRAVMDADGLSFTARNVKIITTDGKVTLRGPVKTPAEKSRVEEVARKAAGTTPVVSQLEIEH
jgi:hyperosmotically inducible protein